MPGAAGMFCSDEFGTAQPSYLEQSRISQEVVMSRTKTRVNKVATVIVPVTDQERAVDFYVNKLGFTMRVDVPFGGGYRWIEVGLGDESTTIALAPPPEGKPTGDRET